MSFVVGEVEVTNEIALAPTAVIRDGAVESAGDLSVNVQSFFFDLAGVKGKFKGVLCQSVQDGYTNFVFLDENTNLQINITGYPADKIAIRLARVIANNGVITRIIHERAFLTCSLPEGVLDGYAGSSTDEKVKVSANDDTEGFLNGKLIEGDHIVLTENNDGGNETFSIGSPVISDILVALDGYEPLDAYGTILMWGDSGLAGSTTTRYLTPGFHNAIAELNPVQFQLPRGGTIRNMTVTQNVTNGNGNDIVYTLRLNNVATALSVTMASTDFSGINMMDSADADALDLIDIEVTKAVAIAQSPVNIVLTLELF